MMMIFSPPETDTRLETTEDTACAQLSRRVHTPLPQTTGLTEEKSPGALDPRPEGCCNGTITLIDPSIRHTALHTSLKRRGVEMCVV